jgi:hypothetical protein
MSNGRRRFDAFVFLLGTFVTSPCSLALLATALHLDLFLRQMQSINVQILLITGV